MNNPNFIPMPFPFNLLSPQVSQSPPISPNDVPARVKAGMEFIAMMAQKQMPRAVASDHQIEVIDGLKLDVPEFATLEAACSMLSHYFMGKLKMDEWESSRDKNMKAIIGNESPQRGYVTDCYLCLKLGRARQDCLICKGSGQIMITAVEDAK